MIREDFHTHTTFCDGKNTPREMVEWALAHGMERIGLCHHSYTPFDPYYCIAPARCEEFIRTVRALKAEYRGRIEVYCGIESDILSDAPIKGYDYEIGSVHYLQNGEELVPVDGKEEVLVRAVRTYYGGDFFALCEHYYREVARWAERKPTFIGHIDLVTKLNEGARLFDWEHPRYLAAAYAAIDALLPLGVPFEINTGAISRGYRTTPYPHPKLLSYILEHGGTVILSGDAHAAQSLCCEFPRCEQLLATLGATPLTYPEWKKRNG